MKYRVPAVPKEALENDPKQTNVRVAKKFEKTPDGYKAYFEGCKYPEKLFPYPQAVRAVKATKGLLMKALEFISEHKWLIPFVFLIKKPLLDKYLEWTHNILKSTYLKPENYCKSGQEIYRAGKVFNKYFTPSEKQIKKWRKEFPEETVQAKIKAKENALRRLIAQIWEYDAPYRYRGQDVIGEMKDNTKAELRKALRKGIERDRNRRVTKKWKIALKLPIPKMVMDFIKELNFDIIGLDEEDLYNCLMRPKYNFKGQDWQTRVNVRKTIDKRWHEMEESKKTKMP